MPLQKLSEYKIFSYVRFCYDMTNLDSILKSRDITLSTKVHLVQAMVFPVVMYGCESWTIKKAEHQRINAFEMWYWRRFESPLDCKEIQPVHPKGDRPWMLGWKTKLWHKDREAWRAAVHGVTKSQTGLRDWTELMLGDMGKIMHLYLPHLWN